jgi:hypothetical protein
MNAARVSLDNALNKYRLSPHKSLRKPKTCLWSFSALPVMVIYPQFSRRSSKLWGEKTGNRSSISSVARGRALHRSAHSFQTIKVHTTTPSTRSLHCQLLRSSFNNVCGSSMLFRKFAINLKHYTVAKLQAFTWNNTPPPLSVRHNTWQLTMIFQNSTGFLYRAQGLIFYHHILKWLCPKHFETSPDFSLLTFWHSSFTFKF